MKKLCGQILIGMICITSYAQDPQFSQFYAAPLNLGPSLAGSANDGRLVLNYRDQWPKMAGRFVTYAVSYDQYVEKYNSGIGINLLHDNSGSGKLTTTLAGINYSYRLQATNQIAIQPGIRGYYYQRKLNFDKLTFTDQFFGDMVLPSSIENAPELDRGYMDFATSILVFTEKLWIGASVDHMMKINKSLEDDIRYVPMKYALFGGITFNIFESFLRKEQQKVSLAYHFKNQDGINQLDIGGYYFRQPFNIGLWYRGLPVISNSTMSDALILSAGFNFDQIYISYSYDLTISYLINNTGGAHELAMIYRFNTAISGNRKGKIRAVPCPDF